MSSQQDSPSFSDAFKTIKLEDFKEVNKIPCSRNALLYGMATGVAVGAICFLTKRAVKTSANWAVGTFCGVSAISFEMCQMERKAKLEKLRMIVKTTDSKEKLKITERRSGAFDVVIETPTK
ncbi:unnamed protein product [Rhizopus stolonifer]